MSMVNAVFARQVRFRAPKKGVFIELAWLVGRESQEACVRVGDIAATCGVSESTVRKCYSQLVAAGYLQHIAQPALHLHYRLTPDWQVAA